MVSFFRQFIGSGPDRFQTFVRPLVPTSALEDCHVFGDLVKKPMNNLREVAESKIRFQNFRRFSEGYVSRVIPHDPSKPAPSDQQIWDIPNPLSLDELRRHSRDCQHSARGWNRLECGGFDAFSSFFIYFYVFFMVRCRWVHPSTPNTEGVFLRWFIMEKTGSKTLGLPQCRNRN